MNEFPIFNGFGDELEHKLTTLSAKVKSFKQDDYIFMCGDAVSAIGVVLTGCVRVSKENIDGNINIISELRTSELFAEAFLCAGITVSPVTVQAASDCDILFIPFAKAHSDQQLVSNLLFIIARKSMMLSQKIEIMAGRNIREKLLLFLKTQKGMAKTKKFAIPYNREELAHYLCVDRSAMSRELCKMRDEGIIKFRKNEFELI